VSVVREPDPTVQELTGQRCHSGCWKVARASKATHRFLARKRSHDGNRFFEDTCGKRSPERSGYPSGLMKPRR
jgi:hypothetical protein